MGCAGGRSLEKPGGAGASSAKQAAKAAQKQEQDQGGGGLAGSRQADRDESSSRKCCAPRLGPLYKGSVWSMSTNSVKILRAKSAGFSNLRYSRRESTSADCSARLACDIDAEEERVTQQAGIPGEVRNRDQDVPWMLTVTFRIGRRPTRSTTGTARPCKSHGIFFHPCSCHDHWCLLAPFSSQAHCVGASSLLYK